MELSETKILEYLGETPPRSLAVYPEIDSTNNAARLLARSGAAHGTAVIADHQTAGRGRLGRSFFSPSGAGMYLSVVLCPTSVDGSLLPPAGTLLLTPAIAVAGARAIEEVCGVSVRIKWVNDLYLDGKKLCGILCESAVGADRPGRVVAGIGINLLDASFPPELADVATSLAAAAVEVDPNRLIAAVLRQIDQLCGQLETREFMEEYRARSCVLGKQVLVLRHDGQSFPARALSIDDNGRLEVEDGFGQRLLLCSGEITLKGDWR